ncbi:hypothetical protein AAG906_037165 [Vitis piasezkii]
MGNYKFRLSDMMPNAWFYKLKDMGRGRGHNSGHSIKKKQSTKTAAAQAGKPKQPHRDCPRKSYYFTRDPISSDGFFHSPTNPKVSDTNFPDPPRRSSKQRVRRRALRSSPRLVTSSVSAGCSCRATLESVWTKSDSTPDFWDSPLDSSPDGVSLLPELGSDRIRSAESFDGMVSWASSCSCRVDSTANDFVIDVEEKSFSRKFDKLDGFETISELDLPPIITKPAKFNDMVNDIKKKEMTEPVKVRRSSAKFEERNAHGSLSVKIVKEESIGMKAQKPSPVRRFSGNSPGVRLRNNSPRIASRKIQSHGRKSVSSTSSSSSRRSLSDSFAIVKSSFDPQRDFRDSMMEMIVENNIRASKDLEELLACYLSLNSDEYHDIIIKVFKQIWFDIPDVHK